MQNEPVASFLWERGPGVSTGWKPALLPAAPSPKPSPPTPYIMDGWEGSGQMMRFGVWSGNKGKGRRRGAFPLQRKS
jgi:hypothetical protein